MNYKGINYDTGTRTVTGRVTRENFDLETINKEIQIIKDELHCNAIRISGFDLERVEKAAEIALNLGLTVWFSPSLQYENQDNTLKYISDAADAAEKLRRLFPRLIFVAGCEFTLFTSGFVKGDTGNARLKNMFGPLSILKNLLGVKRTYNKRLNDFLQQAVIEIRERFHGQLTYASGNWEKVDWNMFDIIGVDLYRSVYNKSIYLKELERYKMFGKPLYITEFGCCAYKGADDKGAMGWAIVDWKKHKPELKTEQARDEGTQAKYILELLDIFDKEKVSGGFVFTFIMCNYVHNSNPKYDLDMASYGIVKVLEDNKSGYEGLSWVPKQAFFDLGKYYSNR